MAGISSKAFAFGTPVNRKKFNGGTELGHNEFNDGSGLELYETPFRSFDPQLGRFHQLDKLGEVSFSSSLYVFASNNPILRNDPLGLKDTIVNNEKAETKDLDNVYLKPGKRKSISGVSLSYGIAGASFAADFAAMSRVANNLSKFGPEAVAIGVFGLAIYRNWESIKGTFTGENYLPNQIAAIWLAMITDPALQSQLDLLEAFSDVIVEELNKLGGDDYLVYELIAAKTPTLVPNLEWGDKLAKIRTNLVSLKKGETVKYGITSKPLVIGPLNTIARYTYKQLPANIRQGNTVRVKGIAAARFLETTLIIRYVRDNHRFPPMNTMFK